MTFFKASSFWLLFLSSFCQASIVWDKEINEFKTSFSIANNSNIYNQVDSAISAKSANAAVSYTMLKLYEGYGVYLPIQASTELFTISELNSTSYNFAPQLKVFLSESLETSMFFHTEQKSLFSGDSDVGYIINEASVTQNLDAAQLSLSFGRAPKLQFFDINLRTDRVAQEVKGDIKSEIITSRISSEYGYKITEDSYFLLNGLVANEEKEDVNSELYEVGIGFMSKFKGLHQVKLIAGQYIRSSDESIKGKFWRASNNWLLTQSSTLNLATSRHNVLTHALNNYSQLTTQYIIDFKHIISDIHQIVIKLQYNKQQQQQSLHFILKKSISANWSWALNDALQMNTQLTFTDVLNEVNESRQQTKLAIMFGYVL